MSPVEYVADPRVRDGSCWRCNAPANGALIVQGPEERYSFYACDEHTEWVIRRAVAALAEVFGKDAIRAAME